MPSRRSVGMNCATRNRQPAPSSGIGDSASTLIVFEPLTQSPVAARDVNAAINAADKAAAGATSHNHPAGISSRRSVRATTCVAAATTRTRSSPIVDREPVSCAMRPARGRRQRPCATVPRRIPYDMPSRASRAEEHARLQRRDDVRLVASGVC